MNTGDAIGENRSSFLYKMVINPSWEVLPFTALFNMLQICNSYGQCISPDFLNVLVSCN